MSKKLHVLFLAGWYPSNVLEKNGDFIQRHAEAVSLENKVSVLHIISDKSCTKTIKYSSKEINGVFTHIAYVKSSKNPIIKGYRFYKAFIKMLKEIAFFDVVHLNILFPFGLFALYLKCFKKKPFLITEHWTHYLPKQQKKINFIEKIISKIICKNSSSICPVSEDLSKSMKKLGLKGKYKVVGNVVDTDLFIPAKKNNSNFNIVHISSLNNTQKNIIGMLHVAKKLEQEIGNFTWKFIGGTSENYKKLLSDLAFGKANIEFLNHISQKELVTHLQQATLYISFSNYETFGIVMTEAISCGVPVISTNTGILTEQKQKDYFKIIPVKNEAILLKEIVNFKKEKFNKEEMHNFIKNSYSKKIIASKFTNLYKEILH